MLDAALDFMRRGEPDAGGRDPRRRRSSRTRMTIGELRDLSFNLEPVVLRDHGLGDGGQRARAGRRDRARHRSSTSTSPRPRCSASARRRRCTRSCARRSRARSAAGRRRRSPCGSRREERGARSRSTIHDDAPGERRQRSIEVLEERARTLGAAMSVDQRRRRDDDAARPADVRRLRVRSAPRWRTVTCSSSGRPPATSSASATATRRRRRRGRAGRQDAARHEGRAVAAAGRQARVRVYLGRPKRLSHNERLCRPATLGGALPRPQQHSKRPRLRRSEAEHERLREPARVSAGRDAAGIDARRLDPSRSPRRRAPASSTRSPPIVCVTAAATCTATRAGGRRTGACGSTTVPPAARAARRVAARVEPCVVEHVPRARADELREIVLVPRDTCAA